MALRQQPDRLIMPGRAGIGARLIPFLQLKNAQMISHMRHASPSATHGALIYTLRPTLGIPAESITRNPYDATPEWSLAEVVTALQAMRGLDLVAAVTVLAEIGDLSRFQTPRELMGYLGL